jgi:hypothetical protein
MQISTDGYGMACAQSGRYKISNMIMLNVSSIFVLRAIFTYGCVFRSQEGVRHGRSEYVTDNVRDPWVTLSALTMV